MTDEEKTVLKFLSFVLPIVYIIAGIPLALKRVAPGGVYGFRTPETLSSPDVWYSVNFVGGLSLILAGVLAFIFIWVLHKPTKTGSIRKLIASLGVSILAVLVAIMAAFWLG